jgi:hypothetical protein
MFKCPNCHKMFMQWDARAKVIMCYGCRCAQMIRVPRALWEGQRTPTTAELQEYIDAFKRGRKNNGA